MVSRCFAFIMIYKYENGKFNTFIWESVLLAKKKKPEEMRKKQCIYHLRFITFIHRMFKNTIAEKLAEMKLNDEKTEKQKNE